MANRDRPIFRVIAFPEGKDAIPLNLTDRILSFSFEDHETKADKLSLTVNNWDLSQFDDPTWRKGTILEVTWGYVGDMTPARRCVVQKISGGRTLKIEAHGLSMLMHKIKKVRVWHNMTMQQIADKIAAEYKDVINYKDSVSQLVAAHKAGIQNAEVESFIKTNPDLDQKVAQRTQAAETDAAFLTRLAKRHGLQFYVDGQGVHFKERNLTQAPVRSYTWYNGDGHEAEFIDFEIENDVTARAGRITKKGFDPLSKKVISHTADNDSTKRPGTAPVVEILDAKTGALTLQKRAAEEHTEHSSEPALAGLKGQTQGAYRQTQHHTVKLSFTCVGDPNVLGKRIVEFKGIGKRLSGRYYVKEVTHTIDNSGYVIKGKAHTDGHGGYGANNAKSKAALNKKDPTDKLEVLQKLDKQTGVLTDTYRRKGEEPHS